MKTNLLVLGLSMTLTFTACSKGEDSLTMAPGDNNAFNPATAPLLRQGSFIGTPGHAVSGVVKMYLAQGKHYLRFENFSSVNGPDLRVYLATDLNASRFLTLGLLKGTSGVQTYEIRKRLISPNSTNA